MKSAQLFAFLSLLSTGAYAQSLTTFVPLRSVWKYLDNGSNQGTAWRAAGFDDSTWAQGPAELGYGDGDEATAVGYGGNANAKFITTYFRRSFTVTGAAAFTSANLRVRRDDGVVIYLNGTEVYRNTMPAGTITYTTLATTAVADEVSLFPGTVNPALLVDGTNVLAVEIHQSAVNSSDISFDMDFTGTVAGNTPVANAQSVTATEDTAKAITLTGSDPNGDPLTYAIAAQPAKGVLSGTPPNLTYTPNLNTNGADSFTFTVSDGTNVSTPAAVSLTVTAVNDVPVADAQSLSLAEDTSATITLSGSDVESHYGTLADYTQQFYTGSLTGMADGLSGATFNENTGTLFLIINDAAGAGTSYEYTAAGDLIRTISQSGFLDTEAITWMYADTYAIAEENNNQRISIVTIAPGATTLARTAPGNVTWTTPVGNAGNFGIECLCYDAGRDLLYYTTEKPPGATWPVYAMNPATGASTVLCDVNPALFTAGVATDLSDMAFDRATDTILLLSEESDKIIRINRAGTVLEQRGFTTGFTQAEALALTTDRLRMFLGGEPKQFARYALPADTLTYAIVTPPAHGSLSGVPPLLTYTPVPNYYGPDSFTFRMNDGTVPSAPATVTLTVTPANDAPSGGAVTTTAEATEPTLIPLPVSDPDGNELTIQTTAPARGTVTVDGTTVTYTPALYQGPDSFTYTVSDGILTAGPFTVSITVLPFNNAPVASAGSVSTNEDTPAAVMLVATDAESDPLTWTVLTQPAHGTLSGSAPNMTYTPAANYYGPDSFTFRASDGMKVSNTATISLTISAVNDAPVAQAGGGSVEAGSPLPLTLVATDAEGSALTWTITTPPAHGTLSGAPPNVIYTADIAWSGTDSFAFTVNDGQLTSAPAVVGITVAPFNNPPVPVTTGASANEDIVSAITLSATDPESQPVTFTVLTQPTHGTLGGTAPNLTYTPALNYNGSDSFTWAANDGVKSSGLVTCTITVIPVNDAPVAQALVIPTETDVPAPVTLAATDVDSASLTFTVTAGPAHGTLSGTAPALTYTPAAGFTGSDSFTFLANDGALDSAPANVTVTVAVPALDTLVTSGSAWKYLDNGTNQGTAWREAAFDDSAWASGNAQLGYGDGDEAKVINYGPDANNRYITSYFRREFQAPNPNVITGTLKLDLLRDDGAVVYLNGTEIVRSNMGAGTVAWNTLAAANIAAPEESTFYSFLVNRSLLVPGRNVLAVEVHQSAVNSSDVSFDLRLYEGAVTITRGPYVQMTGTDRATVRWRTDVATASKLDYGLSTAALSQSAVSGTVTTEHEMTLTGLAPGTRYYYAAGTATGALASGSSFYFTTHPVAGTAGPYRFWVLGDAGTGTTSQTGVRDAFYSWNGSHNLDGVLLLGDNVYETGTDAEYQTRFFDIYPSKLRNTTFWPCFGNHDSGSASSSTQTGPYYASFTMPKVGEAGGIPSGTEAYYSFDYGNIHFVCLDSEGSSLSTAGSMAQWLRADLDANSRDWLVAFWHHPPYSKGSHDSDNPAADSGKMWNMREVFVPILESYGVDLLLFGHEHTYMRSKFVDGHHGVSSTFDPMTMLKQSGMGDPAVDGAYMKGTGPNQGAIYTVAGSSGKLETFTRNLPVMALYRDELGSVVLDVNGRELQARFLNNQGVVRDNYTIIHNNPPAANALTLNGAEDSVLGVTLTGSDADSDALTFEVVTAPAVGALTGTAPALTYTPPENFHGTASLQFRVFDGRTWSAPAAVTLNIAAVNDAPLAAAGSETAFEDTPVAVTLVASDPDGDALSYTLAVPPAHGTLSGTAPNLTYTPDANWNGVDSFAFTVTDGQAASSVAVVNLTINSVNDAPVAAAVAAETTEDTPVAIQLSGSDADGDTLTVVPLTLPAHGTLSGTPPNLIYTPAENWNGSDSFSYVVTDGTVVSAPAAVTVGVSPVNDSPLAQPLSLTGTEDTAVPITLSGTDADFDALTYTVTLLPAHGVLTGNPPNLTYTAAPQWNGLDSFSYSVSDGTVSSVPVAVTIEISPVDDPPAAAASTVAGNEDTPVGITLTANDPDGDALSYIITTPPLHGTLSGAAPNLIYTPAPGWSGHDVFAFIVNDGTQNSAPAFIAIEVLDTSPPVIVPVADITAEATSAAGAAVTYSATVSDAGPGAVSVVFDPVSGSTFPIGVTPVMITATDAAGNSSTSDFTVTVVDTTPPVIAAHPNVSAVPGGTATIVVYAPESASDSVDPAPVLSYSPESGTAFPIGATTVTITATDASGNSSHRSFTVTVTPLTGTYTISDHQSFGSLRIPSGMSVVVTPTGTLDVTGKLELADGGVLQVNGGSLNFNSGSILSGSFIIFNSLGSWNINGDTTFTIGQSLALVSDIHVKAGTTLTVNGNGALILDGCTINSQTPGSPYNITAAADGLLKIARSVVTDANITINTTLDPPLRSEVYDNRLETCTITVSPASGTRIFHNIFDAVTTNASLVAAPYAAVDGWSNVMDQAHLQNRFTLNYEAPENPGRTLDSAGNLFVQSSDVVVVKLDVSHLGSNAITGAEALLGYNSSLLALHTESPAVTAEAGWQVIFDNSSHTGALGMVDSALGLDLIGPAADGSTADATIAKVLFNPLGEGRTSSFFRVQTNGVYVPDSDDLLQDTRLTASSAGIPSFLTSFTANSGDLIIDDQDPVILPGTVTATQVQNGGAVNVLTPPAANIVHRDGTPVMITFSAMDYGLSGLDATDAANDIAFLATNGITSLGISPADYTVSAVELSPGVVTYTVALNVPAAAATVGTYTMSASVLDRSGNSSPVATLGSFTVMHQAQVTVELERFGGFARDVAIVATDSLGAVLATWVRPVLNVSGNGVGSVVLEDVPAGTAFISAKTPWTLRSKLPAPFTPTGTCSVSLTGADRLRGGDLNGDNVINTQDYLILRFHWNTNHAVADINGDGGVAIGDYNLLRANFFAIGDAQ